MPLGADPLALFIRDASDRIGRFADAGLAVRVPAEYRSAARSVARQAAGGWTLTLTDDKGFAARSAVRDFSLSRNFAVQCDRVLEMVMSAANPDLCQVVARTGGTIAKRRAAVMSAFFHYFVAHEFIHIEQGLGSDQYRDSDTYMPIVMEADHVADVSGLVLTVHAEIPEIAMLDPRERVLLLAAIHIASMHSFDPGDGAGTDSYAFSRLIVWYLHFARFTKAAHCPDFASPSFLRAWTVTLPRLVGRADQMISVEGLDARRADPYPANSDVVLAYYHEDGNYRIHRAALTDGERVSRLAGAVAEGRFDDVRLELEELLVNNPALVPQPQGSPDLEWAAGAVIDELGRMGEVEPGDATSLAVRIGSARAAYDRLRSVARGAVRPSPAFKALLDSGDVLLDELETAADRATADLPQLRRKVLSVVDQIVTEAI